MHVGYRWYDPGLGRFIQRDPIGISGGWNVYLHNDADPTSYADPAGLYKTVEDIVIDRKRNRILVHVYHYPEGLEKLTWDGPRYVCTRCYPLVSDRAGDCETFNDACAAAGDHGEALVKAATKGQEEVEKESKKNVWRWLRRCFRRR